MLETAQNCIFQAMLPTWPGKNFYVLTDSIRTNVEFMKLGLAGFSIIVASGDDGSGNDCSQMKVLSI